MRKIGKTIILNETESPYKGKCTTDIMNKSHNIIRIHRNTGELEIIKVKYLSPTNLVKTK